MAPSLDRKLPVASALRHRTVAHGDGSRRPSDGHSSRETGAKVVGGQTACIAGYVELTFEVAGVKRDIRVAVIPEDKVNCYLGANFVREFGFLHDPIKNQLIVTMANEQRVDLEVAALSSVEALEMPAIGPDDVKVQRREMAEIVARILGDSDSALGCTS